MQKFILHTIKIAAGLLAMMFLGNSYASSSAIDFSNRVSAATQEHQNCIKMSEDYQKSGLNNCENQSNLIQKANCRNRINAEYRRLNSVCGNTFTRQIQNTK